MGWFDEAVLEFLEEIKDEHLMDLPTEQGGKSLYSNKFLRLDRQNITSQEPRCQNLQIQVNRNKNLPTSCKKHQGRSIIKVLIPMGETWTAERFVEEAKKGVLKEFK